MPLVVHSGNIALVWFDLSTHNRLFACVVTSVPPYFRALFVARGTWHCSHIFQKRFWVYSWRCSVMNVHSSVAPPSSSSVECRLNSALSLKKLLKPFSWLVEIENPDGSWWSLFAMWYIHGISLACWGCAQSFCPAPHWKKNWAKFTITFFLNSSFSDYFLQCWLWFFKQQMSNIAFAGACEDTWCWNDKRQLLFIHIFIYKHGFSTLHRIIQPLSRASQHSALAILNADFWQIFHRKYYVLHFWQWLNKWMY